MNILPRRQDILKAKNDATKKEIDEGIALATRIDKLRETKVNEEKALISWRHNSIKEIQKEIDEYLQVKNNLEEEIEVGKKYHRKLIEPVEKEWAEVNLEKSNNKKISEEIVKRIKEIEKKEKLLEIERQKISDLVIKTQENEKETEKNKSETIALKEMAQREYEIAREERENQSKYYDTKIQEVIEREKEYTVALSVIAIRENEVKQKEVEIITRERNLERRIKNLQNVQDILKNES